MKGLMDGLGLSIPPFTGKPWWTASCNDNDSPVKKEEMKECIKKEQVDCGSSSAKRQKCSGDDTNDN